MASVFTYQEDVKRIHSPWSTPGNTTPQGRGYQDAFDDLGHNVNGVTRLEPEKQDGPCEYKLHLLLRARRKFVSMSTANNASGYLHARATPSVPSGTSPSDTSFQRSSYQPSPQTRQSRLQQLTTQLLWRLQQSSPFHSSTNAQLVLPVLPEATPRLGVPERPAKLLPGLEESQGALYELGVHDDGSLVGLAEDELEESLNNLSAMSASLGCVCDVLLRAAVGECEWADIDDHEISTSLHHGQLFVAEVLVRPDSRATPHIAADSRSSVVDLSARAEAGTTIKSETSAGSQQLRIAFTGASTAGKSSLVGTLTTSMLDNGRGKSRLSLLKHRHEIASGVTSSVAHELIGYKTGDEADDFVVNYAAGDVSSWTDIHNLASRLCFLIDSPGLPRYGKSIFRTLVSWEPQWVIFCIAADEDDDSSARSAYAASSESAGASDIQNTSEMSLAHLGLCVRLGFPIIVAITKMDLATKAGLRLVLGKVLSALKTAGRQPMLLSSPSTPIPTFALDSNKALPDLQHVSSTERQELDNVISLIEQDQSKGVVPIVMTSAVTGSGIGKVHALLGTLSLHEEDSTAHRHQGEGNTEPSPLFHIDEVFSIPPSKVYSSDTAARLSTQGLVLCGRLACGEIAVGDFLRLGPFLPDEAYTRFNMPRSKSYPAQGMRRSSKTTPASLAKSLQEDTHPEHGTKTPSNAIFAAVRVVSIRNLRLPVLGMRHAETGTIGIELVHESDATISLNKARKGMVLLGSRQENTASRCFTATFPATDFVSTSPPLILGGHAIAYIHSIRAAVKVTAVALADDGTEPSSPTEVFAFDGDEDDAEVGTPEDHQEKEIKITFRFGSTVEWMQIGDQVLVVPTVSASGPVAGMVGTTGGLAGFVGRVCELHI